VSDRHVQPWLEGPSAEAVRAAVRSVAPHVAGAVRLSDELYLGSKPSWQRGTAWLGAGHVVKFAWSQAAANEVDRERRALLALAETPFRRWLAPIEATSERPLLIVTRRVEGEPCAGAALADGAAAVPGDLAEALATLHDPAVLEAVTRAVADLPEPVPQAGTDAIRGRLHPFVDPAHLPRIRRWCDWVDEVQSGAAGERVLLHGDAHGYNLVVAGSRLRCVLDYDAVAAGDHHFDFRYLPDIEPTIGFFRRAVERYERLTGRRIEPAPVLAWHIRTVLGDALWRSEAGVPLPGGGGTVDEWIEALQGRIARLAAWRPFDAPPLNNRCLAPVIHTSGRSRR
jgi:aminoglycoside phosphotransferase (APT) family kinase protein